jgi:hypothetical protein
VLKKLGLVTAAVAATAMLGAGGIAYAGDYDGDHDGHSSNDDSDGPAHLWRGDNNTYCVSKENHEQHNSGRQLIGGNGSASDLNGPGGASADQVVVCPSVGNHNKVKLPQH